MTEKTSEIKRIGILGGTFDPIHLGHIEPAISTAKYLGLEQITLLPAHIPPHKRFTSANANQRKEMVELVCQESTLFSLDMRELRRNTPSYTVETLKEIKAESPSSQIFFIIGMDSLLSFTTWFKWQEILQYCHLVVNTRPDHDLAIANEDTQRLLKKHHIDNISQIGNKAAGNIIIRHKESWHVSSTVLRQQLKQQAKLSNLIPESVANYILKHKLYR